VHLAEKGEAVKRKINFFIEKLELPAVLLKKETIEEMQGYRELHDICRADDVDIQLEIMLTEKSHRLFDNDGLVSVILDSPYLKSSLSLNGKGVWTPTAPQKLSVALEKDTPLLLPPIAPKKPE
jgi:hypothetical protein